MKNIKNISLLIALLLITIGTYAQTSPSKPAPKGGFIQNPKPLKMQPPTKVPAAKPIQPAAKPAGAAAK